MKKENTFFIYKVSNNNINYLRETKVKKMMFKYQEHYYDEENTNMICRKNMKKEGQILSLHFHIFFFFFGINTHQ